MKRKVINWPVLGLISVLMMLAVFNIETPLATKASETHPLRVVDEAGILTDTEEAELLLQVDEISERQQFDVVIVTVESLGGEEIQYYAADYYDYNGYGMGENYDGAMFIISMEERDWFVLTTGYGIEVLTDREIDYMADEVVPYLSEGEYARAFSMFAEYCDKQIIHESAEENAEENVGENEIIYDEDVYYEGGNAVEPEPPGIILSVVIGLVLAFVPVLFMSSQLKSVRMENSAGRYENRGSRNLTVKQDIFLYHTVNRVPKPKENSSGNSTTFRGSSGRSHGGRGGGF